MAPHAIVGRQRAVGTAIVRIFRERHGADATTEGRRAGVAHPASTMHLVLPPADGDRWIALSDAPLPLDVASAWAVTASCGALVVFCGTARDHAPNRPGVTELVYEAYQEQATPRLAAVADEAARRWPLGRIALLHRTGRLVPGDTAVVVAVSAPHRAEAFDAARWCIDTLKATVPLWKRETWDGGVDWGTDAVGLGEVEER